MTRVIDLPVLVLNRRWEPVGVFDVATAITTVVRGLGWVVDPASYALLEFEAWRDLRPAGAAMIPTPSGEIPAPELIVLRDYAAQPRRRLSFNRRNLHRRDQARCQYCGEGVGLEQATIDHVHPRSRGGATSWENCVTACGPCNTRKADRTPREAGMRLLSQPGQPALRPTLRLPREHVRPSWASFVERAPFQLELR